MLPGHVGLDLVAQDDDNFTSRGLSEFFELSTYPSVLILGGIRNTTPFDQPIRLGPPT